MKTARSRVKTSKFRLPVTTTKILLFEKYKNLKNKTKKKRFFFKCFLLLKVSLIRSFDLWSCFFVVFSLVIAKPSFATVFKSQMLIVNNKVIIVSIIFSEIKIERLLAGLNNRLRVKRRN